MLDAACKNESRLSTAHAQAARNLGVNRDALHHTQPDLKNHLSSLPADVEWIYGRDGYLTVREGGRWWSGCSLPLRAAQRMLQTMEMPTSVACLLNPAHAAQVRVVLDMLERPQAIIALLPDLGALQMVMSCDDFSLALAQHRLWFATSDRWEEQLQRLMEENDGLPIPNQFIRPIAADSTFTDSLVAPAQKIFNAQSARRAALVREERRRWKPAGNRKVLVVAPSHFRLWDDAGFVLAKVIEAGTGKSELRADDTILEAVLVDPDNPASASPVALIRAAAACDAIITANVGRADLPEIVPEQIPWITWAAGTRIPAPPAQASHDRLLVTTAEAHKRAAAMGWPATRVDIANWPLPLPIASHDLNAESGGNIVLIADTRPLDPPEQISEYSSHAVLWDAIRQELLDNPFAVRDAAAYLDDRRRQMQIPHDNFDRVLIIERLIFPAFAQGICRALIKLGLPLRCWGKGWERLEEFQAVADGPVVSRDHLRQIAQSAAALVSPVPDNCAHPIDALGRPVLRATGTRQEFIKGARAALAGRLTTPAPPARPLNMEIIEKCLRMTESALSRPAGGASSR